MAVNVLLNFGDHSAYVLILAIFVTAVVVVISTVYLLRGLFKFGAEDNTSEEVRSKRDNNNHVIGNVSTNSGDNNGNDQIEIDENKETVVTKETLNKQNLSPRYPDPVEYCEHIQGEFKRVQQSVATRTIKKSLTEQQLQEEKEVQRRQLGEIFRLMQEQQDRFGIGSMDDMQEQMKLYAL